MPSTIRPTYPAAFSIGLLSLIFIVSCLLSYLIFDVPVHEFDQNPSVYLGMLLVGCAVVIMLLILWEEFLFPITVKEVNGGMIFRNHRTKLMTQVLIYSTIPAIFIFIYLEYEVNLFRFFICASVCIIAPVLEKLVSGINNYNDFLKLTPEKIEYKDNEKEGSFEIKDIRKIVVIKEGKNGIKQIDLHFTNNKNVTIDIDRMELDAFYDFIDSYITKQYKKLMEERIIAN